MKANYHNSAVIVHKDTESNTYCRLNVLHLDDHNLVTHQVALDNEQCIIKVKKEFQFYFRLVIWYLY